MKNLTKKALTVLAGSSLLMYVFTPFASAATTLEISGNGSYSDNTASVVSTQEKTVVQSNEAFVCNEINANANTGNNTASDNTGGDVTVATGNAAATVDVENRLNLNRVTSTTPNTENVSALISGNGSESDNTVAITLDRDVSVFQDNYADVNNNVNAHAQTGYNDANRNTGGDVTVITGHAVSDVAVTNQANANIADLGSRNGATNGTTDIRILGNGSYSNNTVSFLDQRSVTLVQDNYADIVNDIDATAVTGYNDANDNTGGDVVVDTGMAQSVVTVDTMANFNYANIDGAMQSALAKINGNGTESENYLFNTLANDMQIFQGGEEGAGNLFDVRNRLNNNPDSGWNDLNRNTSWVGGDPMVISGHAVSNTAVRNAANANIFGSGVTLPGGTNLLFTFDLDSIFAGLL